MSNCPNRKHPDWITTVSRVGIVGAYRLFVNNGYQIPVGTAFRTQEDVEEYLSSTNKLGKYRGRYYVLSADPKTYAARMDILYKEIDRINDVYGGTVLYMEHTPLDASVKGRYGAHYIGINTEALKDFWNEFKRKSEEANEQIIDGEVKIPDSIYQMRESGTMDVEDYKDFKRKSEYLLQFFPGYEIVQDFKQPIPALIKTDGKTISVNPYMLTTDAIGHEFGHILIDAIGGMSNPLVKQARKQLENSLIETQVRKNYPELEVKDPDTFDKEVIAQAIGIKSAEELQTIFSSEGKRADWRRWLSLFFNKIKQSLGIEQDAVLELTRKMVEGRWDRSDKKVKDIINEEYEKTFKEKNLSPIEKLRQEVLDSLYKKKVIKGRHGVNKDLEKIEKLIIDINKLEDNPVRALKLFQEFAFDETEKVYLDYLEMDRKKTQGEISFTIKQLNNWKNYISGFSMLDEYITLIEDAMYDKSNTDLSNKIKKELSLEKLQTIRTRHDKIKQIYITEGRGLTAKFLAKHSNHISVRFKELSEREYNKLSKEEKSKINKEDYIKEQLDLNDSKIRSLTENNILVELTKASNDIGQITRWLDNLLDSSDPVVSSMVNAFAKTMHKSRLDRLNLRDQFVEILRDLEKFQASKTGLFKDYKDFYGFMLEKNEEGEYTQNIVDTFSSQFWMDFGKFKKTQEKKRLIPKSRKKSELDWKNKNAPMGIEGEKQFRKDRQTLVDNLYKEGKLTDTELKKVEMYFSHPFDYELSDLINDESSETIINWVRENAWSYRTPIAKYENSQWKELVKIAGGDTSKLSTKQQIELVQKSEDPRLKFYNFIRKNIDELQGNVPYIHRLYTRLPGVVKPTNERIRSGEKPLSIIKQSLKEGFDVLADEAERGETVQREIISEEGKPIMFIPVHYTGKIDKTDQSYDLADIYFKYFSSAIDYSSKHEILPEMELARFLVNQRELVDRDSSGRPIIDALKGKEIAKSGLNSMIAGQLNDWFEAVIYGKKEKNEGKIGNVDVAKAANLLNKYTSLNLLGINFVQGTANVILGSTLQWIESFGGEHYGTKDYLKAKKIYNKNLPGILGDIGSRKQENLVNLINREFDTLNDYPGGKFRRDSRFSQLLSSDTLFFTSHAGEHMMQSKVTLAMLNKIPAKDSKGNIVGTMLDMAKVKDGKLVFEDASGNAISNFGEEERAIFEGKVKRLLSSLHGEYSELGRVAVQRYALGRLAYMFRKFVMTGFRRRWASKRVNNISGEYVEGNYRTTGRFLKSFFKDLRGFQLSLMSEDWNSLTDMEKANIKKTLGEIAFLLAAIVMIKMFDGAGDDDDDWLLSFLGYQAYRFRSELTFFINPTATMQILRSPAASMSMIENSLKFVGQLMDPVISGDFQFDVYERGNWKGTPKIQKTMINFIPVYKQIYRLKYVDDQISWLRN